MSRARGTHCTGGAHGAGARFPRERVRHCLRGALPFANPLIIGPIVPISICPGRSLLPSMRHWDTDRLVLHLPLPFPRPSFNSVHEELPGATSKCRRVHRPGGQRALLDPPRHAARVPGELIFVYIWAISMTSCFVHRRSSCTATTSRLGTFLFIYFCMGNCTDDVVFRLILLQGE